MKIKNAAKKIGSAIYEMEQKSAEKPRILGSSQKQIIFLVLIIIFSFWVGYKLLSYSILDGDKWRMMATDQQLSSVVIKANRGSIYDANRNHPQRELHRVGRHHLPAQHRSFQHESQGAVRHQGEGAN